MAIEGVTGSAGEIELREVGERLWRQKKVIGNSSLLCSLIGVAIALIMPPIFRAEILVAPVLDSSEQYGSFATQFGGLAALAGLNVETVSGSAAAIATLKSRALTERFIEEDQLLPLLFSSDWDSKANTWKMTFGEPPTLWHGYKEFDKKIRTITVDRKSGLVALSIDWRDPVQASQWANELVSRANQQLQLDAIEESRKTIGYLENQLKTLNAVEVREAVFRLIEAETKKMAVAQARREYAFKVIDPAEPPKERHSPHRTIIVIISFFVGLLLSCYWALRQPAREKAG